MSELTRFALQIPMHRLSCCDDEVSLEIYNLAIYYQCHNYIFDIVNFFFPLLLFCEGIDKANFTYKRSTHCHYSGYIFVVSDKKCEPLPMM